MLIRAPVKLNTCLQNHMKLYISTSIEADSEPLALWGEGSLSLGEAGILFNLGSNPNVGVSWSLQDCPRERRIGFA
jgi:hypothetical protein